MPASRLPSIAQLVSPFPLEAFTRQYDGRAPVVLRPVVSTPLDLPRLDAFVATAGLRWPTVYLEDADGPVHPDAYTRSVQWGAGVEHHLADPAALHAGLVAGKRLVLPELQRHHAETAQLVRAFERALHMRGRATAVLAPASAAPRVRPAVAEHQHLLQCHGLRACTVRSPEGAEESFEVVVGCALYVPPGHTVTTAPEGGPSLSVDLALRPIRVRDVAAAELGSLPRDTLRDLAPVGLWAEHLAAEGSEKAAVGPAWSARVDALLGEIDHGAVVESLVDGFVQSRLPSLRGQLLARSRPVRPDARFRRRPDAMVRVVRVPDGVELRFHGKAVRLPTGAEELARHLTEAPEWGLDDLFGVPESHRRSLALRLVSEGLCEQLP